MQHEEEKSTIVESSTWRLDAMACGKLAFNGGPCFIGRLLRGKGGIRGWAWAWAYLYDLWGFRLGLCVCRCVCVNVCGYVDEGSMQTISNCNRCPCFFPTVQ